MSIYNLQRFIEAQERSYELALKEIQTGGKKSHWIWFIFSQQKGVDHSYNSQFYGLDGVGEVTQYLNRPVSGS